MRLAFASIEADGNHLVHFSAASRRCYTICSAASAAANRPFIVRLTLASSNEKLFASVQAMLYYDRPVCRKFVKAEARVPDAVAKIRSKKSHVIFLTEMNLAFIWLGYDAVFVGRCPAFDDRSHEESSTADN